MSLPLTPFVVWAAPSGASRLSRGRCAHSYAQADERVIYASVVDKDGAPVLDLTIKDFIVREDGQAREVLRVARDNDPLQIALLVDNSVVDASPAVAAAQGGRGVHRSDARRRASSRSSRSPSVRRFSSATRPIARRCAKRIDKHVAYEAGNYLLDGIAETSQGLAKRTMWRSAIAVITGLGPEMSYRQYTEVLRFFREGGASLHVLQVGMRHRRTGARDRRQQGHVGNRRPLRGSPDADGPRAEVAAARDGAVESVSRDLRKTQPARSAVED